MSDVQETTVTLETRARAELAGMQKVLDAIAHLEADSAVRVLDWALQQLGRPQRRSASQITSPAIAVAASSQPTSGFEGAADVVAAAGPRTGADRALAVAYWFQVVNGQADFEAKALNSELKHLGHQLSNVTKTLSDLMEQRPALVIQTHKSGKSFQARKRYKLTHAGIARVNEMMTQSQNGTDEE
jgi:hypothetical protein